MPMQKISQSNVLNINQKKLWELCGIQKDINQLKCLIKK